MALTGLAIAAAIGLAKSELVDKPKEQRQRKLASETQRNSPWTGLQANPIQEADPIGTAMQFGATGAQIGAGKEASDLAKTNGARVNYNVNSAPAPQYNLGVDYSMPQYQMKKTPWG